MEKKYIIMSGQKRAAIELTCEFCKELFLTRQGGKLKRFCSSDCWNKAKVNNAQVEVTCAFCSKTFLKKKSLLKNSKSGLRFCNATCKCNAQKLGGITEIMPFHYGAGDGRYSCRNIIQEGSECVDCKENRLYYLVIHHVDGDRSNNDVINLEIVCAKCHTKRHLKNVDGKWIFCTSVLTPRNMLSYL